LCTHLSSFDATALIYIRTLSLHDALPISAPVYLEIVRGGSSRMRERESHLDPIAGLKCRRGNGTTPEARPRCSARPRAGGRCRSDRKSTRLNSSHVAISYAVFCLKKKNRQ